MKRQRACNGENEVAELLPLEIKGKVELDICERQELIQKGQKLEDLD